MISYESFTKIFPRKLIKKIKSPIVPYTQNIGNEILKELFQEIKNYTYHPSLCHEYLVFNKNKGVIRITPIFKPKDTILYYFCVKMIEDEIAENRVSGTYGGWRIGNKIRYIENQEEINISEYTYNDSFNPLLWFANWKDFQKKAYLYSENSTSNYIIKFDIANFYDNINLHLLEKKLYSVIKNNKRFYVELLLYFLKNWNKTIAGFSENHVGLPQENIGDCSRLLANFYLQDYDCFMKELCDKNNSRYLRYSDDQIVFAPSKEIANKILFEASKFLLNQGLNFNSNKINVFKNKNDFNVYWCFDIFRLLSKKDKESINQAIEIFLERLKDNKNFRMESVLKRILSIDINKIEPMFRHKLLSIFYNKDFLSKIDYWTLNKLYNRIEESKKEEFLIILKDLANSVIYNSFHYNLVKFYEMNNISYDKEILTNRINELRI